MQKDYYAVLELSRDASAQEIKKSYRRLARQYHPDVNPEPSAREQFKAISEAYEVLGDAERRQLYDQGHIDKSWFEQQNFSHIQDIFKQSENFRQERAQPASKKKSSGFGGFGSFFENLVGNNAPRSGTKTRNAGAKKGPSQTADLSALHVEQSVALTLEEAYTGCRKAVQVQRDKMCVLCGGKGKVAGSKICRNCQGSGKVSETRQLDVKIPAGVREGSKVRVPHEGLKEGQDRGHLYLVVTLLPHAIFDVLDDADLSCRVPVTVTEAIVGAEIKVPTLSGQVKFKIPAGTQPSRRFRLRGKGLKDLKDRPSGDLYVSVDIHIPTDLSVEEKENYQKWFRSGKTLRQDWLQKNR